MLRRVLPHALSASVTLARAVAPASFLLVAFRVFAVLTGRRSNLLLSRTTWQRRVLNVWLALESLFFVYCRVVGMRAQQQPPKERVPRLTTAERSLLFSRCLATVPSASGFCLDWFQTKVAYEELRRDNLLEWLAWGLFHEHAFALMSPPDRRELDTLVLQFELATGQHLPLGYNASAKLLKFSQEPVTFTHRPLVLYAVVHFVLQEVVAPLRLRFLRGFRATRVGELRIWYRAPLCADASHNRRHPIVFIHGLGVGILPYESFLQNVISATHDSRGVMLIELQAVSQRISPPELFPDRFVEQVRVALADERHSKAVFCGHSYGTFPVSWVVKSAPELVAGVVLLDPASLLLHHPDVLVSILYKRPSTPQERFVHYVIREELFWNAHARRHFFFYANIVFLEDIATADVPVLVVLSTDDPIVPVSRVLPYVEEYNAGRRLAGQRGHAGRVDLVVLQDCDHGGFLWNQAHGRAVVQGVQRLVAKLEDLAV